MELSRSARQGLCARPPHPKECVAQCTHTHEVWWVQMQGKDHFRNFRYYTWICTSPGRSRRSETVKTQWEESARYCQETPISGKYFYRRQDYDEKKDRVLPSRLPGSSRNYYKQCAKQSKVLIESKHVELAENHCIYIRELTSTVFQEFLVDSRDNVSISLLKHYRSSLFNIFKDHQWCSLLNSRSSVVPVTNIWNENLLQNKFWVNEKRQKVKTLYYLVCFTGLINNCWNLKNYLLMLAFWSLRIRCANLWKLKWFSHRFCLGVMMYLLKQNITNRASFLGLFTRLRK